MAVGIVDLANNGIQTTPSTQDDVQEFPHIKLAMYNIQSGRGGRLERALGEIKQMNIDIDILTKTKLIDGIYTRFSSGYHVHATETTSNNKGGAAFFWRDCPN